MLKIQRKTNGKAVFTLSGRIEAGDIDELRRLLELEGVEKQFALDLKDVTLVDPEGIEFLRECEAKHIELQNRPSYVREQMAHGSGQPRRTKTRSRGKTPKRGGKQ